MVTLLLTLSPAILFSKGRFVLQLVVSPASETFTPAILLFYF